MMLRANQITRCLALAMLLGASTAGQAAGHPLPGLELVGVVKSGNADDQAVVQIDGQSRVLYWLDAIEEVMKNFTTDDLLSRLDEHGVPFGKVKTIREFQQDPQAIHNRTFFDAEHSDAGTMRYIRYPGHMSDTPASLHKHPPRLGEHSAEILKEAGYSDEDIAGFVSSAVVGTYQ